MRQQHWVLGATILLVVAACWMGRYELTPDHTARGGAYRLDRWTGAVVLVDGDTMVSVKWEVEDAGMTPPPHASGTLPDNSDGKPRR